MGHCESDLGGEVRDGFLEETMFGLSSKGRLEKKSKGKNILGRGSRMAQSRRKLGGFVGIMRCFRPPYANCLFILP